MESDTFYTDFVVKSILRLYDNLINHQLSMKTPDNLHIDFTIKSP